VPVEDVLARDRVLVGIDLGSGPFREGLRGLGRVFHRVHGLFERVQDRLGVLAVEGGEPGPEGGLGGQRLPPLPLLAAEEVAEGAVLRVGLVLVREDVVVHHRSDGVGRLLFERHGPAPGRQPGGQPEALGLLAELAEEGVVEGGLGEGGRDVLRVVPVAAVLDGPVLALGQPEPGHGRGGGRLL
jgi:hypothetical protein